MSKGTAIGVIVVSRKNPGSFSAHHVELLRTFADQAVIAIENVRLFNETQEALERQTATADILKVIASSPSDVQPVLQTLAISALRLCEALSATVLLRDGEVVIPLAHVGPLLAPLGERQPLHRGWVTGRAVLEGITIHVPDMLEMSEGEYPDGKIMALKYGHRATLAAPLIREGWAIGAILVRRRDPRPFSDKQIALLETFADQAVIAIENARLFNEVQARTKTSRRWSGRPQPPTSSRSSPLAVRCAAGVRDGCEQRGKALRAMFGHDHNADRGRATLERIRADRSGFDHEAARNVFRFRSSRITSPSTRAILERRIIAIPDADAPDTPEYTRRISAAGGFRSVTLCR